MNNELTAEVLAEMKRLDCCGWFTPELASLMGNHRSALIAAAEREQEQQKRIAELEAELRNIAEAKPSTWGDDSDQFQPWAQNRARHALKGVAR